MIHILGGMAAIIVIGLLWRITLGEKSAEKVRSHLVSAVYYIFLPALALQLMWATPMNADSIRVPVVAGIVILTSLLVASLIYAGGRWFVGTPLQRRKTLGAALLACGFGNFTYLGLPVVSQVFGEWAQVVAIQFDMFASTPILFTIGVLMAAYYGSSKEQPHPVRELISVPALWAALLGLCVGILGWSQPLWLENSLEILSAAVVPLMLLSIGMALRWQAGWVLRVPILIPVVLIQLVLMPWMVWGLGSVANMSVDVLHVAIIEGAMPSMVLGLVLCERFKLDVSLYAEAVTLTTACSLLTLPMWLSVLQV
ncbi:MAG: AEC family transporter, partial [Mariprofundaceae bacterium]|nr:AEC family transporter [Mariprofundaceae bacterium]